MLQFDIPRDVADGIDEHDEWHLLRVGRIVVVEVLLDDGDHLGGVLHLRVEARVGIGHHEIAKDEMRDVLLDNDAQHRPGAVAAPLALLWLAE